jgi:hypothetical protein
LAKAIEIDTQPTNLKTLAPKKTYRTWLPVGTDPAGFGGEMTE